MTSIVVENGNPKYDSRNSCNAIIETESNTLIAGCKSTIIPNYVTTIGNYAFLGCTGLTSIKSNILSPDKVSMYSYVFSIVDKSNCTLYVPQSTKGVSGDVAVE